MGLESQGVVTIRNDSEVPIDFRRGGPGGLGGPGGWGSQWWRNGGEKCWMKFAQINGIYCVNTVNSMVCGKSNSGMMLMC